MTRKPVDRHVAFATRYADPVGGWLSASTAISRLDELIRDAKKLAAYLDKTEPVEERWYPWFGAEIISYYAVGYVTCLEWHARSRLVDLINSSPTALRPGDLFKDQG